MLKRLEKEISKSPDPLDRFQLVERELEVLNLIC